MLQLHSVFKDYDKDGSGKISLEEFTAHLKKKKEESKPKPGQKSTLEERKASEGISILDLSEGAFHEMDTDGDGSVTFLEILKLVFHKASKAEFETMQSWVAAEPEPEGGVQVDLRWWRLALPSGEEARYAFCLLSSSPVSVPPAASG